MRTSKWVVPSTLTSPRCLWPRSSRLIHVNAAATESPLTRWSRLLVKKSALLRRRCAASAPEAGAIAHLPVRVVLEGCHSAFNATNAMRVSLFFATAAPITFVGLEGLDDIKSLTRRPDEPHTDERDLAHLAHFSAAPVTHARRADARSVPAAWPAESRVVCVECFVSGAKSVNAIGTFFAAGGAANSNEMQPEVGGGDVLMVMGDENKGVSGAALAAATDIVFIPQFGTISSLNVVTSMGIALFHAFMMFFFPGSRQLPVAAVGLGGERTHGVPLLQQYMAQYSKPLPTRSSGDAGTNVCVSANAGVRVDPRPVHPFFYNMSRDEIVASHAALVAPLRQTTPRGVAAILFENDVDRRNFGGLVRNANAFCCNCVVYCGAKHVNRKGAVGTDRYTPLVHLGRVRGDDGRSLDSAAVEAVASSLQHLLRANGWSLWLLCSHHDELYDAADAARLASWREKSGPPPLVAMDDSEVDIERHLADDAATNGVVLLVAQEGIVPLEPLLRLCSKEVVVSRRAAASHDNAWHCGLPPQVASGIVLQRLFSIAHKKMRL